jgi:hypothetical protein
MVDKNYEDSFFMEADGTKNYDKYVDGTWKQGKSPEARKHHFQKGHKSPGRPVGSKNRKTLRQELVDKGGMTPAQFLSSVVNDENANMSQRIRAAEAAAKFFDASLSSVEIHTDDEEASPFNIFISPAIAKEVKEKDCDCEGEEDCDCDKDKEE